jgi:hypothetical protein
MTKRKKHYDIVEVVWMDAEEEGDVGWNCLAKQLREAKKPCPEMHSVGYEVYRNGSHIALLSTMGKDLGSTLEKIPMGMVIRVTKLSQDNPASSDID